MVHGYTITHLYRPHRVRPCSDPFLSKTRMASRCGFHTVRAKTRPSIKFRTHSGEWWISFTMVPAISFSSNRTKLATYMPHSVGTPITLCSTNSHSQARVSVRLHTALH